MTKEAKAQRYWIRLKAIGARGVALLAVLVALSIVLASAVVPSFRVCHDRLAATGDAGIVKVCEPIVGEPGMLALFALLIILLLLPLLSKFDIAGLFGVELRDVRRTAEAAKESAALAETVASLAEKQAKTAQRHAEEIVSLQGEVQRLQDLLVIRVGVIERGGLAAQHGTRILETESVEETGAQAQELIASLLVLWQEIEAWAFINKRGARLGVTGSRARALRPDGAPLSVRQRKAVEDWRRLFGFEIDFLSRVRNSAVHDPGATRIEDLRAAIATAELIVTALRNALERP